MATTSNFGWETPDDTDLVKDGAAAIRTLGSAIDTSLVDLKGGTTGQSLTKNSNTDMDFAWATPTSGGMTLLASGSLSGTITTLSSISGGYKDLRLVIRDFLPTVNNASLQFRFNTDTTSNRHYTLTAVNVTMNAPNNTKISANPTIDNTVVSDGLTVIDIFDYANTTTQKTCWIFTMHPGTSTTNGYMGMRGGWYNQTSAITAISIFDDNTSNDTGNYYLYGVN
jgi:hypothetical protein